MFDFLRYSIGGAIWFFVLGYALWRGEWAERTVAATRLAGMLITPIVYNRMLTTQPDFGVMIVDVIVLAVMLAVALRSDRWWPIFCAAFFLITVCIHFVRFTRPDTSGPVYVTARILFAYMALWAQAAGMIALEMRRRREAAAAVH